MGVVGGAMSGLAGVRSVGRVGTWLLPPFTASERKLMMLSNASLGREKTSLAPMVSHEYLTESGYSAGDSAGWPKQSPFISLTMSYSTGA